MSVTVPTADEISGLALRGMLFAESIGSYGSLLLQIDFNGDKIRQSGNADVRRRFENLLTRLPAAIDYERAHGRGSLLRLEHPTVRRLIQSGLVREEEIAAARGREGCPIKSGWKITDD